MDPTSGPSHGRNSRYPWSREDPSLQLEGDVIYGKLFLRRPTRLSLEVPKYTRRDANLECFLEGRQSCVIVFYLRFIYQGDSDSSHNHIASSSFLTRRESKLCFSLLPPHRLILFQVFSVPHHFIGLNHGHRSELVLFPPPHNGPSSVPTHLGLLRADQVRRRRL